MSGLTAMKGKPGPRYVWERFGQCNSCGECCNLHSHKVKPEDTTPTILLSDDPKNHPEKEIKWGKDGWCEQYDKDTGKCKDYLNRPLACAVFPAHPDAVKGGGFKKCGYIFKRVPRF